MRVTRSLLLVLCASTLFLLARGSVECQDCKIVQDGGDLDGTYFLDGYDKGVCPSGCIYTKEEEEEEDTNEEEEDYYCFQPSNLTYTVPCPPPEDEECGPPSCGITCKPGQECIEDTDMNCVEPPCCAQWMCLYPPPLPSGSGDDECAAERVCTADWSPVCGKDGETYSNRCLACEIGVACDGECPCSGQITPKPAGKTTTKSNLKTTKKSKETIKPGNNGTTSKPTDKCKCGIKKQGTRIVGGKGAQVNEYPWMVSLQTSEKSHLCGASLIASRWIATAAHCFYDGSGNLQISNPGDLNAVIGEHDIFLDQEVLKKTLAIEKIIIHENYDFQTNVNDITLLRLVQDVDLKVYTPVCLPESGKDYSGKTAWVYGWGTLSSGGESPDKLQELEVPIVDDSKCSDAFKNIIQETISSHQLSVMICAGGNAGKDSCQGDSGGPLSYDNNGQHQLVGIVSWGIGCAREGLYGVYAEVSALRTWIDQSLEKNGGATYC